MTQPRTTLLPLGYYELIAAFAQEGCAVCRLALRSADGYLDSLLYELVNDADIRRAFRDRRGLCNEHSWQLLQYVGESLGVALLYESTVDEVLTVIERTELKSLTRGLAHFLDNRERLDAASLANALQPVHACSACKMMTQSEERNLSAFASTFDDERLQTAYRNSDGLCLPHFQMALRRIRNATRVQRMISVQTEIWQHLKADLHEFADKYDYRRRHEPMGRERNSYMRAIESMAGKKGVFGVDPRSA